MLTKTSQPGAEPANVFEDRVNARAMAGRVVRRWWPLRA